MPLVVAGVALIPRLGAAVFQLLHTSCDWHRLLPLLLALAHASRLLLLQLAARTKRLTALTALHHTLQTLRLVLAALVAACCTQLGQRSEQ